MPCRAPQTKSRFDRDEWWRGARPLTAADKQHARQYSPYARPVVAVRKLGVGHFLQARHNPMTDGKLYYVYRVVPGHEVPQFVKCVTALQQAWSVTQ